MTASSLIILAGTFAAFSVALVTLVLYQAQRRERRYDASQTRAELESYRRFTEERLYKLTEQLLASGERWRDVNHLILDSQGYQQLGSQARVVMTPFLRNAGLSEADLEVDLKLVLVLTPFSSKFQSEFDNIALACKDVGLTAVRGDEEYQPRDIMSHVLRLLVRARLVVANVDGRNPNVFYELGLAHALNKPVILVASSVDSIPFDVSGRKVVLAEDPKRLRSELQIEITRSLV